jgi:hypothetical protein
VYSLVASALTATRLAFSLSAVLANKTKGISKMTSFERALNITSDFVLKELAIEVFVSIKARETLRMGQTGN